MVQLTKKEQFAAFILKFTWNKIYSNWFALKEKVVKSFTKCAENMEWGSNVLL